VVIPVKGSVARIRQKFKYFFGVFFQAASITIDVPSQANNSRNIEWICNAIPLEVRRRLQLDWIQINYDRQVLPDDQVALIIKSPTTQPDHWTVEGLNRSINTRALMAALHWRVNSPSDDGSLAHPFSSSCINHPPGTQLAPDIACIIKYPSST
jgi:hypothetical protein